MIGQPLGKINADLLEGKTANDIASSVGGIPSGMIAIFDTSCPTGWTRVSAFDGLFLRGSDTYGGTGGAETHTHSIDPPSTATSSNGLHYHGFTVPSYNTGNQSAYHTHLISYEEDTIYYTVGGESKTFMTNVQYTNQESQTHTHSAGGVTANTVGSGTHTHTVDIAAFDSSSASNLPPYIDVVFCKKD